jgi:hypothetical protein
MLRVEFNHDANGTLFVRLQGRLVGPYAENARITLARYQVPARIVVDLAEVTFIDSLGEEVLLWLGRLGAEFLPDNVYTRCVCERLQLHISEKRAGSLSAMK